MPDRTSRYQQVLLNAIPVIGYWFWDWSMFAIVYIYWVEALIMSLFVFLKVLMARGEDPLSGEVPSAGSKLYAAIKVLFIRVGILMFYWIFIFLFVGMGQGKYKPEQTMEHLQILVFMHSGFNLAVLAFFLSQIIDFMRGFIYNDDYLVKPSRSYKLYFDARTIIIHVVVVLGTFSYQFLERYAFVDNRLPGLGFVLLLFFLKTIADLIIHSEAYKKARVDLGTVER
jgi:hypothetical protein